MTTINQPSNVANIALRDFVWVDCVNTDCDKHLYFSFGKAGIYRPLLVQVLQQLAIYQELSLVLLDMLEALHWKLVGKYENNIVDFVEFNGN